MKAIETEYKGYKFRSRLEARWAVFFDALGLHWEYEPEGYELPSGRYLPDFILRPKTGNKGAWYVLEIKGNDAADVDLSLLDELCKHLGCMGMLLQGDPLDHVSHTRYGFGFSSEMSPDGSLWFFGTIKWGCPSLTDENQLYAAAKASRSARFEFGQSGAVAPV